MQSTQGRASRYPIITLFIHSFIQTISIAPLQVHYYPEALSTQHEYCVGISRQSVTDNLRVKDLPRVRERVSNPRPSGQRAPTLPMSHQAPDYAINTKYSYDISQ